MNYNVKWNDVAGQDYAKEQLKETIILPIKFPQLFQGMRRPPKGILLYGPSGTGKQLLVEACATEAECKLLKVSCLDLIRDYKDYQLENIFKLAREDRISIVFIKDVDLIFSCDEKETNRNIIIELMIEMDDITKKNSQIQIVASTTRPWLLSNTLRKRFEKMIPITLPDLSARLLIIEKNKIKSNLSQAQWEYIAQKTEGYSGSEISFLIQSASYQALNKLKSAIKFKQVIIEGKVKWTPVLDNSEGTPMNFTQLNQDEIEIQDVCYEDYLLSLEDKRQIKVQEVDQFQKWAEQYQQ